MPSVARPCEAVLMYHPSLSLPPQVLAGKLRLILLRGPLGNCVVTGDFNPAKLDETLEHFCGGARYASSS